jgi:PAS domain S-box-containing protein
LTLLTEFAALQAPEGNPVPQGQDEGRDRDRVRSLLPALIVWLVLSGTVYGLGSIYIERLQDEAVTASKAQASVGAQAIEQVLLRSFQAIDDIHATVQMRMSMVENKDPNGAAAVEAHIAALAKREDFGVVQISIVGPDGRLIWSTAPDWMPTWLGDREYFKIQAKADAGLYFRPPYLDKASNRWSVDLTRRLTTADGSFAGVSVVSFDPFMLSELLKQLKFGDNGHSTVWSVPQGDLIAGSKDIDKLIGRTPDPDVQAVLAARDTPSGTLDVVSRIDGRPLIQAYRKVGNFPAVALVSLDRNEEMEDVRTIATLIRLGSIGFAVLTGALQALVEVLAARRRGKSALALAQREAKLAVATRSRIALLLSGLPAAVYGGRIRSDGTNIDFSIAETARRLTGWDIEDLTPHHAWALKSVRMTGEDWQNFFQELYEAGEARIEYQFQCNDGSLMWVRDEARVVAHPEPGQASIVGYISDISRDREMQAKAIASSKLATLGEMATGLAHELNQPIATMSLAAENAAHMLRTKVSGGIPFALSRMARIAEQAQRARTIVNHLRIFGRQNAEEVGPVDLRVVVEGALQLVGGALRSATVAVDVRIDPDCPQVLAEPVLAEHVLVNLMLNARDAMASNPPDRMKRLLIRAEVDDKAQLVILTIQDTGPGIPEEMISKIFEPFYTTKGIGKGTGLGLSICHGIMTSFHGSISVENPRGGGAMFITTFQRADNVSKLDGEGPEGHSIAISS